jgi:Tol biopolymer transport system component
MRRRFAFVLCFALCVTAGAQGAHSGTPPFTAVYEAEPGLVLEAPSLSIRRPLLSSPLRGDGNGVLSPRADRVAFTRPAPATAAGLYVVGLSGTKPRRLQRLTPAEARRTEAWWTPDTKAVVHTSSFCAGPSVSQRPPVVWVTTTAGASRSIQLEQVAPPACIRSAVLSPAGDKLAYLVGTTAAPQVSVYTLDLETRRETFVTSAVSLAGLAWSHAESTLAVLDCAATAPLSCRVDTVPATGGALTPVSPRKFQSEAGLAWSPNGQEVIVGETFGLYAANAGKGTVRRVAGWSDIGVSGGGTVLDFSDDGRFTALGIDNGSGISLFVVALAGGQKTSYLLFWNSVGSYSVRFQHRR